MSSSGLQKQNIMHYPKRVAILYFIVLCLSTLTVSLADLIVRVEQALLIKSIKSPLLIFFHLAV